MSQWDSVSSSLPHTSTKIDRPSVANCPQSPKHPPAKVYTRRSSTTYAGYLSLFLLTLLIPLVFSFLLYAKGAISVPRGIVSFSHTYPRLTPQIITIACSGLTAGVKWGFAGAVTVYARKELQKSRPIHNIELFSALKNGAVVWSWDRRPVSMLSTCVAAILCGLLTSGFVTLVSPFPIATTKVIGEGTLTEFDLSSPDASCYGWLKNTNTETVPASTCFGPTPDLAYSYVPNRCTYRDPFGDDITTVKSAMTYRFASNLSSNQMPNLVHSLPSFSSIRLVGGTAGTLAIGPAGVTSFPNSTFPYLISTALSSYNYTLGLQGIWAESSCSYTDKSRLIIRSLRKEQRNITLKCPDGDTPVQWDDVVYFSSRAGMILVGLCLNDRSDVFTFHLRSLWTVNDTGPDRSTDSSAESYAGIGSMECSIAPRIGIVNAAYQTELAAFNMTHSEVYTPFSKMEPLTKYIVLDGMTAMLATLSVVRSEWNGNLFGGAIYYVAGLYCGIMAQRHRPILQTLLADGLKGLFEYHMTKRRFRLNVATLGLPPPSQTCLRSVTGVFVQRSIGWDISAATVLGLIPLVIVSLASIALIVRTMMQSGKLVLFDPTNPVSLIAAASDGKLQFVKIEERLSPLGDPGDEFVKNTNVRYGEHEKGWGLKVE